MKRFLRVVSILSGFTGVFLACYDLVIMLIAKFLVGRSYNSGAAAIGIIGGADGPTAIYIASKNPDILRYFLAFILILASIFSHSLLKRK